METNTKISNKESPSVHWDSAAPKGRSAAYLFSRFLRHTREKGVCYAVYRGILYSFYLCKALRSGCALIEDTALRKLLRLRGAKAALGSGRLKLTVDAQMTSIDLYWDGVKLTRNLGFIVALRDVFHRHLYSNGAFWKIAVVSSDSVRIRLVWPLSRTEQLWTIRLKEESCIEWDIAMSTRRGTGFAEQETGLMLSGHYARWINSLEEGEFPAAGAGGIGWHEIECWSLSSRSVGVRSCTQEGNYMPALMLHFNGLQADAEPKIRSFDRESSIRVLLASIKKDDQPIAAEKNKMREVFSGKIEIMADEKEVERRIVDCKSRMYSERTSFIEEEIPRRYQSKTMRPVEVLLVNLPWKEGGYCGVRAGSRWPHIKGKGEEGYLPFPFFLAHTASVLLREGFNVRIIDALAADIDCSDFSATVNDLDPRLLIAEISTPSLKNDLGILKSIRRKGTLVAVCGLDFNMRSPAFLAEHDFIDFVMFGEYEFTALELFKSIKAGRSPKGISGLIHREEGVIKVNPARYPFEDIDRLPWPLREQLPMHKYMDAPGNIAFPSVQMLASRGCPYKCTFCAWPQLMYNNSPYRFRNVKRIADEMEYLLKERKYKSIYFDDDTFNINKKNIFDLCSEIRARDLRFEWAIMARADIMEEETLLRMRQAGLAAVKYGVESADQELLNKVRKNMDLKRSERMIRFTKSLGIKTHLTFTFGLPGESRDTIRRTIEYALDLDPDSVQFSIMTPYPGTEYYNELDAKGYITSKDWSEYNGASKSVIRTDNLSPQDLERARLAALREWKRHVRRKHRILAMPFDRELKAAFHNNLRRNGIFHTLFKTVKYVLNF